MHRLLLYTLVVVLLSLAWSARQAESLAAGPQPSPGEAPSSPAEEVADAAEHGDALAWAEGVSTRRLSEPDLFERLEARVEAKPDLWSRIELEVPEGPPPEQVLADAEAWMQENFPEGGETARAQEDEANPGTEPGLPADARLGEQALAQADDSAPAEGSAAESPDAPVYLAGVARLESLNGDRPAWCGLLDIALLPARVADLEALAAAGGELPAAETAWISDENGQLIARVEALRGLGLELDPSWPWNTRARRLYWTEAGLGGLPARQFRLVLEGNGLVPSWTGRLVLLRLGAAPSSPTRR